VGLCRVGDSTPELQEAKEYILASGYLLLEGAIPERTGYRRAIDTGRALTETRYPTLNQKADKLIQSIVDSLEKLQHKAA